MNANGTGVAEGFSTAVSDSVPSPRTRKMSIVLPLAFVVTISFRPSGVKPTWPGEVRKFGGSVFASPSERAEPSSARMRSPRISKPWTIPTPPAFRTYTRSS